MRKVNRLQPVRKYAEFRLADAAQRVQVSLGNMQGIQQKISQLQAYVDEYERSFAAVAAQGISVEQLKAHYGFVEQLRQALESQQKVQRAMLGEHQALLEAWRRQNVKLKMIDHVAERYHQEYRRNQEKKEQREIDDRRGQIKKQ